MSGHELGECTPLHTPKTASCTSQEAAGDYDLAWYGTLGMAIAWLGVHPVAIYQLRDDHLEVFEDARALLRSFARKHGGRSDNDTITLTPAGAQYADRMHALEHARGADDRL